MSEAACPHPLDLSGLGLAVPFRSGLLRTRYVREASTTRKLIVQIPSNLLRCFGTGGQLCSLEADFLRVVGGDRHGKSPTGVCGTAN